MCLSGETRGTCRDLAEIKGWEGKGWAAKWEEEQREGKQGRKCFKYQKDRGKGRKTTTKKLRTLGQQYEPTSGRLVAPAWQGSGLLRAYKPSFLL